MKNGENHEIFITADASPTLSFKREDGYAEKMHHSQGALTESLYIYHSALLLAHQMGAPMHIVSVGLGLAYNELISLAELHLQKVPGKIWSFEVEGLLVENLRRWCQDDLDHDQPLHLVGQRVAQHFAMDPSVLKAVASSALREGRWELRGGFPEALGDLAEIGLIFFDAFSSKMSPRLWAEDVLVQSLQHRLAERSVFTTYAATGSLNRALRTLGYSLSKRPGFSGKRESTLAIRG
ncbi:MAG: MnmC family methyltransferase [Bdellovibrionales bacterium]